MKWATDNLKGILAGIVVFFSFMYYFTVTFFDVKPDPQIIIAIVAAMTNVLQYYFGSSQAANNKDKIISDSLEKQNEKSNNQN